METNRKHRPLWNSDIEDRHTVNTLKYYSNTNLDAENVSNARSGQKTKSYVNYGGTSVRQNEQDFHLAVNDDDCSVFRHSSVYDCSSTNPLLCEMERSDSWKFLSYSESVPSLAENSSSSSSSLNSFSEFDQILSSLSSKHKISGAKCERSMSFLLGPSRPKYAALKRSFSTGGHETPRALHFRKLQTMHRQYSLSQSILDDVQHQFDSYDLPYCSDDSEFSSGEEYCSRKRRKMCDDQNEVAESNLSSSITDELWNRLAFESCSSMATNVADDALPTDAEDGLPGQRFGHRSASPVDQQPPSQPSTSAADVNFQRMRSSSVTLGRERAAPWPAVGCSRVHRSFSVASMAAPFAKCHVTQAEDLRDSSRQSPPSWMRASMRLVRPFQLADPPVVRPDPVQSVQIQLPPVFPCEVLERPSSAPVSNRPRQYGRCGRRRRDRVTSVSSPVAPADRAALGGCVRTSGRRGSEGGTRDRGTRSRSARDGDRVARDGDSCGRSARDSAGQSAIPWISRGGRRPSRTSATGTQTANPAARVTLPRRREPANSSGRPSARAASSTAGTYEMSQESESPLGQWSHGLSSMLACLGCTLGIFNISRFAIFSIHFGANFILQFLVLTVLIGIPLFTFHISLGQLLGTGVLNMWHISPIFKGIGIALLLSQAFIGVYSIVGVSWMFVYFRDSFISKQDVYRWAEPLELYGEDGVRTLKYNNGSYKIEQTVPDYFGGVVLQRRNVLKQEEDLMNVKFSVAFNLAIVWIIIFLSLSKGLKSYGKIVYVFSLLPIFGITLLCAKLLGFLPNTSKSHNFFPETDWSEFFLNSKSWVAAFTEVFLTWGVFGASAMQITSHNRQKHYLYRDSALVIFITILVLLLAAFIANMCSQLLEYNNFLYLPSSFERSATYIFLQRMDVPLPHSYATTPIRWMSHSGLILGERTMKPATNVCQESGYQPLRLATELVPATFAAIGPKIISPFWSVLFYFVFIMFGIAQQMAIWYGVISNIVSINPKALKPCWTTIAWFTCIGGFVMGLPLTTETGIFVVYFMDYVIGCGWWIMILYLLQLGAVFIVRGRPYSGETIVATLFVRSNYFLQNWIAPMFSFNWNVILPVTLLLLSTSVFKNGGYRMLYNWHSPKFYEYWPQWSRRFGCFLQVLPLLIIPLVGIVQSYLYLTDGPVDIFERIQMLYRPVLENRSNMHNLNSNDVESSPRNSNNNSNSATVNDDPPPKYTPPPSYSTATGARIAKLLRQSFRRSVIRIAHVLGSGDSTPSTSDNLQSAQRQLPPPPDYSTVLVEINQSRRCLMPTANPSAITVPDGSCANEQSPSPLTALDVANILRSSLGRNRTLPSHTHNSSNNCSASNNSDNCNNLVEQECTSIQCLVDSAVPINQDSIITLDDLKTEEQPA